MQRYGIRIHRYTTLSLIYEMRAFIRNSNYLRIASTPSILMVHARVSHATHSHSVAPWQPLPSCLRPWQPRTTHYWGFSTSPSVHASRMAGTYEDSTLQTLAAADATIFALSTPPGKSAIAVVRASGPACLDVCTLCNRSYNLLTLQYVLTARIHIDLPRPLPQQAPA